MATDHPLEDRLRVGIVGTGSLGRIIGEQFRPLDGAAVVALADIDETSRAEAGEQLRIDVGARFSDYEEMLADADLDAVVITTPHALHDEQITAALDAGLHVLCEKPMVLEADRAREIADRVAVSDRVLMVGYQRHQDAAFRRARERYRTGGLEVRFVTAEITQGWFDVFGDSWRTDPELSGGGFLCDTGRHVVDAVLWTTGLDPVGVTAEMTFDRPGVDRTSHLRIEFASGATAAVSLFGDAPAVRESHHLWDTGGAAYVRGRGWGERDLTLIDGDGTECDPLLDRGAERNKAEAFLAAIREDVPPPATPDDAVRTTAVVEAAYESADRGERVSVDLGPD
jgi:predicted dehydrogenase